MRSRVCLIIATLVAMGCGSSNSNDQGINPPINFGATTGTPGTGGTSGATGQQCGTVSPACIACITQNCNNEAMTTFGGGYMNNQFNGGLCRNIMTCACTASGRANGGMKLCAQQDGTDCEAAFTALTSCLNANPCGTACTGNNGNGGNGGSNGLTVNGNTMAFGNTEVGSAPNRCVAVSGPNASTIIPQVLNDTGCAVGGCAFIVQPLYCRTPDSCDACVVFVPQIVGPVTATFSIASDLTVALSGVGTASPLAGTGGASTSSLPGTGGSVGTGGYLGTGGIASTGGTTSPSTGLACPLGTWATDLGVLCGTTNAHGVSVVTEIVAGRYSVTMTFGPMPGHSQDSCEMLTIVSLSATYASGVFIVTYNPDPDTCPQKLATSTATINADCTQWTAKTNFAGCETCDVTGMCSGCGSMKCPSTGPDNISVRSP